ncbi:hypothetical protein SLEP1_g39105 [Rubroshorea leprosula]|uniref:Uncharacterized protein n=1 Tax=Rubroshorea leprosula TaxID=152421 RepID=A0AAV5KZ58_9ROSI|nr:hypothetical protein SLEP1_g39105 [Rubroshorea leprosula]
MRVLFRKIRCPFICFCKPSPHLYPAGPLKLENGHHVPTTKDVTGTDFTGSDCVSCDYDTARGKDESVVDVNNRQEGGENCQESNLRKADSDGVRRIRIMKSMRQEDVFV